MISYNSVNNQPQSRIECVTIGRLAPDFIGLSTFGYVRLSDYRGKWLILASSPSAFGAVSTTELIETAQYYPKLLKRNTNLIGLTTDNISANLAWVYDIYQKTGITIPFPIIADADLEISEMYGMLNPDRLYGETVRDVFIIDPSGRIKAIITVPVTTGRDTGQIIRILDSIQLQETYNFQTPAGWNPGEPVLLPNVTSYEELINRMNNQEALGYYCPSWYLCYTNFDTKNESNPTPPKVNNNVTHPQVNTSIR